MENDHNTESHTSSPIERNVDQKMSQAMHFSIRSLLIAIAVIALLFAGLTRMPGLTILFVSFVPLCFAAKFALRNKQAPAWKISTLVVLAFIPAYFAAGPPLARGSA